MVVKVGTSVLTDDRNLLDEGRVGALADDLAALCRAGRQVICVSSGAIGAGLGLLDWKQRPRELARSQAAAAVGQGRLIEVYARALGRHELKVGQILLTREDLSKRTRYLNARATMQALLTAGVVPVVNENDTVSVEEIRFGDNDELAALTAHLMDADLLVNLSNVEGFERRTPGGAELIPLVERITPELERLCGGAGRATSTGGMVSKLAAARIAMASGIPMVLADGKRPGVLSAILLEGHLAGTLFLPRAGGKLKARKRWLAFTGRPKGSLMVDGGAHAALVRRNSSLLASGLKEVVGTFERGELVAVCVAGGGEFARGVTRYGSRELEQIRGMNSQAVASALGRKAEEVIHRDELVILEA